MVSQLAKTRSRFGGLPNQALARLAAMGLMLALAGPARAGSLALSVDADPAAQEQAIPVSGGIPFARGELVDPARVRLLSGGADVPLQADVLATWPDHSVKWLLLSFVAKTGAAGLTLEYGVPARAATGRPLAAAAADGSAVTVDTGVIRFRVDRAGGAFIDELWLDRTGRGTYADDARMIAPVTNARPNFMDFVHLEAPSDFRVLSRTLAGTPDPSHAEIDELRVESAGPIRAVVLLRGHYRYSKLGSTIPNLRATRGACPFTLRLTAWRGLGLVEAEHFFVYEGDPDYDFLRTAGLTANLRLNRAARVCALGASPAAETPLAGVARVGLAQDNVDHFRMWQVAAPVATDATVAEGRRFEGALDVSDDRWGVTVSHRRMWQNYPNGFAVDGASGALTAAFWPAEAGVLDLRRYAREWGVGETGAASGAPIATYSRYAAKGLGKTHTLLFQFHGPGAKPAELQAVARALDARPLLCAAPARTAATLALGHYAIPAADTCPVLEQFMRRTVDLVLDSQERYRWYGFLNYGGVQSRYNAVHKLGRWDNDFGRWGWAGNDGAGRFNHALLLQYLRTGDRRCFDAGEASVLNNFDVWMVHTPEYFWDWNFATPRDVRGLTHRHNVQPFGCPYVGARGAYPVGMKIYYYLTGSGRARDGLDEVLSAATDYLDGKTWRLGHSGAEDGLGTAAQSLLCAWERTGNRKYQDYLLRVLHNSPYFKPASPWEASMTTAFGLFQAATEYQDLVPDPQIAASVEQMARLCQTPEVKKNFTYPGGYFAIFADACRITGKEAFAQECRAALDRETADAMKSAQMTVPPDDWPGPPGGPEVTHNGNTLRDLPYVFGALRPGGAAKAGE